MKQALFPLLFAIVSGCSAPLVREPSLAPRAAEAIDPRVPVPDSIPPAPVDAGLAKALFVQIEIARSGRAEFEARASVAQRLAASAGGMASESWIAAEQALSRLVEQQGITARAAADVDALAGSGLQSNRWLSPADQAAIKAAQKEISSIAAPQLATIDRLTAQLSR